MTAAKPSPNEDMVRKIVLAASTILFAALVSYFVWLGTAMIALQRDVAVLVQGNKAMAANIESLMQSRSGAATRLMERNENRLDDIDAGLGPKAPASGQDPIPVTVTNPPSDPVPVDPAPESKQ